MENTGFFSQHAEVGILSLVLKYPEAIADISTKLKTSMFTSTPNKTLYSNIYSLYSSGSKPDYNLILSYLHSNNQLPQCGGEAYLQYLYNQSFDINTLDELSNIIVESFKARELLAVARDIPTMLSGKSTDDAIAAVRDYLDNISDGRYDSVSTLSDSAKEMWERLKARVSSTDKIKISTGLPQLDSVTGGYMPGDFWVVAGRPGMGKSAMMCNSILTGEPSLIFSREMSRESLVQRLVAIKSGVPVFNIRLGIMTAQQMEQVSTAIKEIKDYPLYIDNNFDSSPEYVISTIRKHQRVNKIATVHFDYLQIGIERDDNATHELGRFTRAFKLLSNNLGISIIAYSQFNRNLESRQDRRPILSDIRQSGNIEEDSDIVVGLYRDVVYNANTKNKDDMEFIILKQRNGPTGTLFFKFDAVSNKIYEKEVK